MASPKRTPRSIGKAKPAEKPAAASPSKRRLGPRSYSARAELTPAYPMSGMTPDRIMAIVDSHMQGQFRDSEDLYWACRRIDRIFGALESRCNAVRAFPFALKLPDGAPQRLVDYTSNLQEAWSSAVLSEAERGEVVERVVFFGFAVCRVLWTYRDGQQTPKLQPWTHSSCWYDPSARDFVVQDAEGHQNRVPLAGDGKEWVVFSAGGQRPWLKGACLPLGRLLAYLGLGYDRWAAFNDTEGQSIKGLITPAIKRESEEVQKLWVTAGELRGGDTVLLPEGFDLKYIQSAARSGAHKTFEEFIAVVERGIAIVLLGHSAAQETTGKTGTYGSTAAALAVARDKSVTDIEVLAAALVPLMRSWVSANFDAKLYQLPRPLLAYSPLPCWDTAEPEDKAAAADTRQKNANAVKALTDAAGGIDALVKAGLDLTATLRMCGMPMAQTAAQRSIASEETPS